MDSKVQVNYNCPVKIGLMLQVGRARFALVYCDIEGSGAKVQVVPFAIANGYPKTYRFEEGVYAGRIKYIKRKKSLFVIFENISPIATLSDNSLGTIAYNIVNMGYSKALDLLRLLDQFSLLNEVTVITLYRKLELIKEDEMNDVVRDIKKLLDDTIAGRQVTYVVNALTLARELGWNDIESKLKRIQNDYLLRYEWSLFKMFDFFNVAVLVVYLVLEAIVNSEFEPSDWDNENLNWAIRHFQILEKNSNFIANNLGINKEDVEAIKEFVNEELLETYA